MKYPTLQKVESPKKLRELSDHELVTLCDEIREFMQSEASVKEGHVKSSLAVVELTVALHYMLRTPEDILLWDVGHQAFAHKIITGRREVFKTIRQKGGISGFCSREESEYDVFGAGHSSTSLSAASGFAESAVLSRKKKKVVAVIGDGALTGGMAYEALNYIGGKDLDVLVVLNDNNSSIDPNVGALSRFKSYRGFFEALGFQYAEGGDGHNLYNVLATLQGKLARFGPQVIRFETEKGRGFRESTPSLEKKYSFHNAVGEILGEIMAERSEVLALSPAMLSGGGLLSLKSRYPERIIDTGITEQHVVTQSAALAADGFVPICHLYSTFAQRAVDQIIHDVALQKLPVIFCIDRAGISGADGSTHQGIWDTGLFASIPNLRIFCPQNAEELANLLFHFSENPEPVMIRYPKDTTELWSGEHAQNWAGYDLYSADEQGNLVISTGTLSNGVREICRELGFTHLHLLEINGKSPAVLGELCSRHSKIHIVEELTPGYSLEKLLRNENYLGQEHSIRRLGLPAEFIEHGSRSELLDHYQLSKAQIKNWLQS